MGMEVGLSRAQQFNNWTNNEANFEKAVNGEKVEEFKMFDFNPSTYSSDLKQFAQEYIDLYDSNGDGKWDKDEFVKMALGEEEVPEGLESAYAELFADSFNALNLDDDKETINAGEYATMLYASDINWDGYLLDLQSNKINSEGIESYTDGKVDYLHYQGFSSLVEGDDSFDFLTSKRLEFYDKHYGK